MMAWSGRVILLDIEGTVSEIAFVHQVLFPYARQNVAGFLASHLARPEIQDVLELMAKDAGAAHSSTWCPFPIESPDGIAWLVRQVHTWMDRDAKLTGLKALQGFIWESGYRDGLLRSHIFPDVPECLRRWTESGKTVAIYSSGSRAAQKLLFAHTTAGDLTPWISAYFDTTSGGKRETTSYHTIARQLGVPESSVLFLSDIPEELAAAASAGMSTSLVNRPGNRATDDQNHPRIRSLEEISVVK
jgi:enolase-phosphatase E1